MSEKTYLKIRNFFKRGKKCLEKHCRPIKMDLSGLALIKEILEHENYVLFKLQGAVDSTTIPSIREDQGKNAYYLKKHVILDFALVSNVDCSTLAGLLDFFMKKKLHNSKLVITSATKQLMGYIEILNLKPVIRVFSNQKSALSYLTEA